MDELNITVLDEGPEPSHVVVNIGGPMTVQFMADLKTALLLAMEKAEQLTLDLSAVTEVDLAGLQLLCSAHLSCLQSNKKFRYISNDNETVKTAGMEAGFERHVGCAQDKDKTCLWVGGKE